MQPSLASLRYQWSASSLQHECSLHQLAPYIGKLKTSIARSLIAKYSFPGGTVLEPFAGSGVVALEALLQGRHIIANDISPYAGVLTRAKLFAPATESGAIRKAIAYSRHAKKLAKRNCWRTNAPTWVKKFFHHKTLSEALVLARILRRQEEWLLLACLLGILHHQRPGFLSYPSSHLVPYLRLRKYPTLYGTEEYIADIDYFIEDTDGVSKLNAWESLWFLTCVFHDPAYIAEKFWGTLRFAYGVPQLGSVEDDELPDSVKKKITDLWDSEFAGPRKDLRDLYNRIAKKKWVPPTLRQTSADDFDSAIQKAYFDGRKTSHSLVSGLRLISLCTSQDVPRAKDYDSIASLTACEIAALCMMFHDQRCRAILTSEGIPPIAFEGLPYASLLMFADALQDDRRDNSLSRFRRHGVLKEVRIRRAPTVVEAVVCLKEVPVKEWAPRMAEYETVMSWINSKSKIKFRIDYKTEAGL